MQKGARALLGKLPREASLLWPHHTGRTQLTKRIGNRANRRRLLASRASMWARDRRTLDLVRMEYEKQHLRQSTKIGLYGYLLGSAVHLLVCPNSIYDSRWLSLGRSPSLL